EQAVPWTPVCWAATHQASRFPFFPMRATENTHMTRPAQPAPEQAYVWLADSLKRLGRRPSDSSRCLSVPIRLQIHTASAVRNQVPEGLPTCRSPTPDRHVTLA